MSIHIKQTANNKTKKKRYPLRISPPTVCASERRGKKKKKKSPRVTFACRSSTLQKNRVALSLSLSQNCFLTLGVFTPNGSACERRICAGQDGPSAQCVTDPYYAPRGLRREQRLNQASKGDRRDCQAGHAAVLPVEIFKIQSALARRKAIRALLKDLQAS